MNPRMLTAARESRRLSGKELAEKAGIAPSTLSKAEHGLNDLSEDKLQAIAEVLDYPRHLFDLAEEIYGFGSSYFHHRRLQSLGQTTLRKAQADLNLWRIQLKLLSNGLNVRAPFTIPVYDPDDFRDGARDVARCVRAAWKLPLGPVDNMIGALERAGALVIRRTLGSPKISAISIRTPDGRPLIVLNYGMPPDRERFTGAHELGHLVMHDAPRESAEREADTFASEFLMPAHEIRPMLAGIDLAKAALLKRYWKTSMASIIRAARDLDVIPEARYRSLCVQMSQRGFHRTEPIDLPPDEPTVVGTMLQIHRQKHGYTIENLADVAALHADEFRQLYGVTDTSRVRALRVVR